MADLQRKIRAAGLITAIGAALLPIWAAPANAATSTGFVVSPAFEQLQIKSSALQSQYTLQIINHNATDQIFLLRVVDFGTLDESGGVAFLGTPATELEHKYGLASWMSLEKNTIFVPADKSVGVLVSIENRQSLATGGHYGAVLATAVSDTDVRVGDRVAVKQVLASLVLMTKEGGAAAELRLAGQQVNSEFWKLPTLVNLRFQNPGNVHVVPRGTVEIKDPFGRLVQRSAINEGSNVILPESFRNYKSIFTNIAPAIWPGYYSLTTRFRYDGKDSLTSQSAGFWYAGKLLVGLMILVVFVGLLTLTAWMWRRKHRN